jgi:hypothetical protein
MQSASSARTRLILTKLSIPNTHNAGYDLQQSIISADKSSFDTS